MAGTSTNATLAPHRDILRLAGISVQSESMYFTSCTCGATCGIYTTPENDTWVHCPHCGFSGMAVEYVAKVRRVSIDDMPQWLKSHEVADDVVSRLMAGARYTPMLAFRALWKRAKRNVEPERIGQGAMTMLQAKRVYNEWNNLPDGLGVLFVHDIADVRSEYPGAQLKVSNVGSHKIFVAAARYDVPGRVCGINLIQTTGESEISSRDRLRNNFTGGLAIDDLSADNTKPVYVFDNQHTALMFQAKVYGSEGRHVRVAVYNFETDTATWDCLRRSLVLYVATDNILEAVGVCRKIPSARIIRVKADELETWILGTTTAMLPSVHPDTRVDWPKAAREWLFEKPAVRHDRRRQLALSAADEQRVLECCTDAERRALLSDEPVCREIVLEGVQVRETAEGYAAMIDRRMEEIANIRISLSHSVVEHSTSKTWYYGYLIFQGTHLAFAVEHSQLQHRAAFLSWVSSMTAAAGLGVPSIRPAWAGRLLTIASKFSTPIIENTDRLLGWSEKTNSLLLPSVVISATHGVENRTSPIDVGIPDGVWSADASYVPLLDDSSSRALEYMAFAIALATSMTATAVGASPYTFVIGAHPDMMATPGDMAQKMGIPVMTHHASKVIDRRYGAAPAIHGFPVLCQPEPGRVIGAVSRTATRSEIVRVGWRAVGFARLFPRTMSVQFPIEEGTPATGHHAYAPMAARLACELTYRALRDGVTGDVAAAVIHAMAGVAKEAKNGEYIHLLLGRILLPPKDDADWCAKYVECVRQHIAAGWLKPAYLIKQGDIEVVDATGVYRGSMDRGSPALHPGAVAERFCAAGIPDRVKVGR